MSLSSEVLNDLAPPARWQPSGRQWMVAVAIVLCLSLAGAFRVWRGMKVSEARPAAAVSEAPVEVRKISTTVTATGIIRLQTGSEVRVGAQISGLVSRLMVTVGSHVNKGDTIAEIDSRGLEARLAQARAQIEIDRAVMEKTSRDLARSHALLDAGLIARKETEDLEEDEKAAEARLAKSQSDLAVVESDLPYLVIRAPIAGTVAAVSTQQGETVAASFAAPNFVTLIEDKALELVAMVDETDIGNVRPSNAVTFTTETYPSRDFHGLVERVAPKATIVSGVVNYEVGISIREGIALLKPDMTANVNIQTAQRDALLIPKQAVENSGDRHFVYLAPEDSSQNQVPDRVEVTLGQGEGSLIEVKKGLTRGSRILVGYFTRHGPKKENQ